MVFSVQHVENKILNFQQIFVSILQPYWQKGYFTLFLQITSIIKVTLISRTLRIAARLLPLQTRHRYFHISFSMAKYNVMFVLGGPGAGKGTQCEKIVEVSFQITKFKLIIIV